MGAIDAEAKAYFSNPEYFSDLFNFWIYYSGNYKSPFTILNNYYHLL